MAIATAAGGDVVGLAAITRIDWVHRRASIGYWILNRHRGRGLAKAAISLLPGLARERGLIRLQALIEPDNHASQFVCRAVGFTEEGALCSYHWIGNRNRDIVMFALVLQPIQLRDTTPDRRASGHR